MTKRPTPDRSKGAIIVSCRYCLVCLYPSKPHNSSIESLAIAYESSSSKEQPQPHQLSYNPMFNFGKQRKLQEERKRQEDLIAAQLRALELEHELEYEKLTQRGLIANKEQKIAKEREQEVQEKKKKLKLARTKSKDDDTATTPAAADDDVGDSDDSSIEEGKKASSKEEMSYVEMARMGYQQLVNAIIRPPRCSYELNQLGPEYFRFAGTQFERTDWTLMTERGYHIEVSQWGQKSNYDRPILIYLHGNASARLEVLPQLTSLLAMGLTVVSLDFAGSGKSDGEYVSLGYYEREDLATVIAHLRRHHRENKNLKIALWGRSMGAATAVMYGARDARIDCLIADSSFASLVKLAEELVETARQQGIVVPNVVVSAALQMIQWSVQKHANFNIRDLSPVTYASDCATIPALFIHGEHDDFIKPHHSQDICEEYTGPKNMLVVEGDHNDPRPATCITACQSFLQRHLQVAEDWHLIDITTLDNPLYPPWFQKSATANCTKTNSSSSTVGYDETKMGMTQQRQHEIKSSIKTMLGAQNEESNAEKHSVEVEMPVSMEKS
eukprot:scaffold12324_cov144-Cylindrotheca_fusiformis.AAC.1